MKITLNEVTVRDLSEGYLDSQINRVFFFSCFSR